MDVKKAEAEAKAKAGCRLKVGGKWTGKKV